MAGRQRRIISIRLIIGCSAAGLTALTVLGMGAVQERNTRAALTTEIESRLLLEARGLALTSSSALLSDFPELILHPLAKEMQEKQPELAMVVVVDHRGIVQGHADPRMLGTALDVRQRLMPEPAARAIPEGSALFGNAKMLVALYPVVHPNGTVIGTTAVGMQREYIDRALAKMRREQSLLLAAALILGVGATLLILRALLRPIAVLRAGLERIGRGVLDRPLALKDRTEFGMLADTINDMASQLKQAQAEMVEKERLSHELELARGIQASLLPSGTTTRGGFLIAGAHRAASEVGGDYYDVFPLPGDRVGVAIADVAGKGLAGCLVTSMLSALLGAYREDYDSPSRLLAKLDERLCERLGPGSFVTMFYGVLDPATAMMVFASAGHLPTLIHRKRSRKIESYPTRGIPLGAVRGGAVRKTLHDVVVRLEPGDLLMQYTDGLSEAFQASGAEQFGLPRVENILSARASEGAAAVLEGIKSAVDSWRHGVPPHDDETLLLVSHENRSLDRAPVSPEPAAEDPAVDDPAAWLATAHEEGEVLALTARMEELEGVRAWLRGRRELERLAEIQLDLLSTAVYEACANVVEHGYHNDAKGTFRVWWIAGAHGPGAVGQAAGRGPVRGTFVVLDSGTRFSPEAWTSTDFSDSKVWRRGRGFGLDIIHGVMSRVQYFPGTSEGNVMILHFDEADLAIEEKETTHEDGTRNQVG